MSGKIYSKTFQEKTFHGELNGTIFLARRAGAMMAAHLQAIS